MENEVIKRRRMKGVVLSDEDWEIFDTVRFSSWVRKKIKESREKGEFVGLN